MLDRIKRFDTITRGPFKDVLQRFLDASPPKKIRIVSGASHNLFVTWRIAADPLERTTNVEVIKLHQNGDGPSDPLPGAKDRAYEVDAMGRNDYFLFTFWHARD
jgi:hypothetical protein